MTSPHGITYILDISTKPTPLCSPSLQSNAPNSIFVASLLADLVCDNGARGEKISLFHGRDGKHIGVGLVEILKIFTTWVKFIHGAVLFDKIYEISRNNWHDEPCLFTC